MTDMECLKRMDGHHDTTTSIFDDTLIEGAAEREKYMFVVGNVVRCEHEHDLVGRTPRRMAAFRRNGDVEKTLPRGVIFAAHRRGTAQGQSIGADTSSSEQTLAGE